MTTPAHILNVNLPQPGPDASTNDRELPTTTRSSLPDAVWRTLAEAITQECVLRYDPETGWGQWATRAHEHRVVFLGFIRVDPQVRAMPDLQGRTLVVRRAATSGGFRVTTDDRHYPQWNSWLVLQMFTRDGWHEARLQSGLRAALVRR